VVGSHTSSLSASGLHWLGLGTEAAIGAVSGAGL